MRKVLLLIFTMIFLSMFFLSLFMLRESDFVRCVYVHNKKDFIGEKIKTNTNFYSKSVVLEEECKTLDKNKDSNDGNTFGKVRWVNCLSGPDCSGAGDF